MATVTPARGQVWLGRERPVCRGLAWLGDMRCDHDVCRRRVVVLGVRRARNGGEIWVRFAGRGGGRGSRSGWRRYTTSRHLFRVRYRYAGRWAEGPPGWLAFLATGAK